MLSAVVRNAETLTLSDFIAENPDLVSPDNAMNFISDDGGENYNNCHCKCDIYHHTHNADQGGSLE